MQIIKIFSLMMGVYLISLYFTYVYPAFKLFVWTSPLMHTLGGLVTAFTIHELLTIYGKTLKVRIEPVGLYMVFLVALTVCVGVGWEIYEYLHDLLFVSSWQPGVGDTLLDLVMDTFGAILFCLFFLKIQPKKSILAVEKKRS